MLGPLETRRTREKTKKSTGETILLGARECKSNYFMRLIEERDARGRTVAGVKTTILEKFRSGIYNLNQVKMTIRLPRGREESPSIKPKKKDGSCKTLRIRRLNLFWGKRDMRISARGGVDEKRTAACPGVVYNPSPINHYQ